MKHCHIVCFTFFMVFMVWWLEACSCASFYVPFCKFLLHGITCESSFSYSVNKHGINVPHVNTMCCNLLHWILIPHIVNLVNFLHTCFSQLQCALSIAKIKILEHRESLLNSTNTILKCFTFWSHGSYLINEDDNQDWSIYLFILCKHF